MARRGIAIVFTLLGVAFFISIAGFIALYFLFGRQPSVPTNAVLTLTIGGDLAEVAPSDVVSYVRGARTPTVRTIVEALRKAKVDRRISAVLLKTTGLTTPVLGQLQESRGALVDLRT